MPGSGEGVQLGGNGDLLATNNWWGCNVDPQSAGANAAGCDTAFKVSTVTGTLTTLPQLVLKNTANPAPIVTGQDTTLTASVNTNSANQDVSQNVIALVDLPVTWSNAVRGNLSNQQTALQSLTRTISTATESGSTVTITTSAAHGFSSGQTVLIAGVGDSRYTGTFTIASTPTTTTFTYTNPVTGLPASSGGTAKVSVGTATATFRASAAGAGAADATAENAVATANFTINKADTTSTITSDTPDPTVTGEPFTVNFSLAVNAPGSNNPTVPTGNVIVTDGVNSCTGAISAAGTGSCIITLFNAGNRSLTATYQGDANFNISPASSPATAHVVNKADTTTALLTDTPDPSVTGQTVAITYSVAVTAPGSGTPTGNVVIMDGANTFCTGTVAAGTCSAAFTTAGNHTLTATYQGDANYNASPASAGAAHTVNKADTTAALLTDTPDPTIRGQQFTVTYSTAVTLPGAGTPTGNVMVTDGVDSCTGTVAAGQCTITLFTVGNRTLTATYQGDANFNASPASSGAAHTVNKINTTETVMSSKNPSDVGDLVTFTATITPTSGTDVPSGTVQFRDGPSGTGTPIGAPATVVNGVATVQTNALTAGSHTIAADYSGDANLNGVNATLAGNQVVIAGTPTANGNVLISEFRFRGSRTPSGAQDEFIELYNNSNAALVVPASGWTLRSVDTLGTTATVFTVSPGTSIPARAHFLVVNNTAATGFSLGGYPAGAATVGTGDAQYTGIDIGDGGGVALYNSSTLFDVTTQLDAVGFTTAPNTLYREGAGLAPAGGVTADGEYSFMRKLNSGQPQDTSDNAADFVFVSTTGGTFGGMQSTLGAPGPESLGSPLQRNATIKATLIDPGCAGSATAATQPCPRFRDSTPDPNPANNSALGTFSIRRRFVNNTGGPVTRLRFRIVDVTAGPAASGTADMRARTSGNQSAVCMGTGLGCSGPGAAITINGTTVEVPPAQASGGGLNTSMTVTLPGGMLANGAAVNVQFLLGIQQGGAYRFFINVEALP